MFQNKVTISNAFAHIIRAIYKSLGILILSIHSRFPLKNYVHNSIANSVNFGDQIFHHVIIIHHK